jgi:TolB-like protein
MEKPFAAYVGPQPYLFACYAHADAAMVYPDLLWLKQAGFNIWYDEGIPAGSTWRDEVALALSRAALIVYFASPASAASSHCQQELSFALSRERPVLCVNLAHTQLAPGLELALSSTQAIHRHELSEATYRSKLDASIRRIEAIASAPAVPTRETVPQPDTDHAIAILPLANRSRDPENEYLSDGITEELIAGLSQLSGLKIKSFLSVAPYRGRQLSPLDIGRELGVASIVAGSLQQVGERVRITVALTRVADGASLWSRHYDNDMQDIFALQDDVARQVVDALRLELTDTEPDKRIVDAGTTDVAAYQTFLLGRHERGKDTPRGRRLALQHFKQAVALDPAWVDAWGELAMTYFWQDISSTSGGDDEALIGLRDAVDRLAILDPAKANTRWYTLDNWLALRSGGDEFALLRDTIRHADRFAPSYVDGAYGRLSGLCRQKALYECGLLLTKGADPRIPGEGGTYQRACLLAGLFRYDAAIDACTEALAEIPGGSAARADRCIWLARTGQYARAAQDLEVLNGIWGTHHFPAFNYHFWRGDVNAARACADWLSQRERYGAIYKGLAALMLGESAAALDYFEIGAQQRRLYGNILRWGADAYLTDSQRAALGTEPRWHAALAAIDADDASRRHLIGLINELAPHTGITLDADGIPQQS